MDYDFSGLCADQIEKLGKSLDSLQKKFIKEYKIILNVINNSVEVSRRSETVTVLENIFNDMRNETVAKYANTMNRVQGVLGAYL